MLQQSFDFAVPPWIPPEIPALIDRGALFVINDSAGKDSQAMKIKLRSIVPADQLVVVHAELPEVEWDGSIEHIEATSHGLPVYVVKANKTLLGMVEDRGMWPSPQFRQCTSDLKRGPITKLIRQLVRETGNKLIVNCIGLRAEESPGRKKQTTFKLDTINSVAGREWYTWLPIHGMLEWQVFASIDAAGEKPHWVYEAGMTRKSCSMCIMSSLGDLKTAARLRPDLYERYVRLERKIGQTMLMPAKGQRRFLDEVVGIPVAA